MALGPGLVRSQEREAVRGVERGERDEVGECGGRRNQAERDARLVNYIMSDLKCMN